jgi:hypothetical protein
VRAAESVRRQNGWAVRRQDRIEILRCACPEHSRRVQDDTNPSPCPSTQFSTSAVGGWRVAGVMTAQRDLLALRGVRARQGC